MIVNEYSLSTLPDTDAHQLLVTAYSTVLQQIETHGDGLLPQGHYSLHADGLELTFFDANNHQQTWGVVGSALMAIGEYFAQYLGDFGAVTFAVFDGPHMVGTGALQLP
ncbi:MAG: hypothetical protein FRX48_05279 [Lasallia pustulata]|uniref:Uncharacterized protein n=1 Tax=Lasallia pustulata TaxID=136370 RepID=A0A5M8PQK7_9LECA|nr:MAG: hypothetical protein FRX48_05279 [Lasallia pustulata]